MHSNQLSRSMIWFWWKNSQPRHKFSPRWNGPYTVVQQVSGHLFELEDDNKHHIRRHTDLMKPFNSPSEGERVHQKEKRKKEKEYEIESIIDSRVDDGNRLYRVRWKGYDEKQDTWEPLGHFKMFSFIRHFKKKKKLPL